MNAEITIQEDLLTIMQLVIRDPNLCRYLEGFPPGEHASRIEDALLIGAEVLQKAHAKSEADYIDKRFAEVSKEFGDRLNDVINGTTKGLSDLTKGTKEELAKLLNPRDGTSPFKERFEALDTLLETIKRELKSEHEKVLSSTQGLAAQFDIGGGEETSHLAKLKKHIGDFETRVRELFNPKGTQESYAVKLNTQLDGIFGESGTLPKLLDQRLAFDKPLSPFGKFKEDVAAKVSDMREKVIESIGDLKKEVEGYRSQNVQAAADREKMSAKGDDFEEAAFELLSPFAEKRGDFVERVGAEVETGTSKKGDLLYRFHANAGVVAIEAKNKKITSMPKFRDELLAGVRNRSAAFGILVVRDEEYLPRGIGEWHFDISTDGIGYIVTHAGLLELSLKIAHARLQYAAAEIAGVDVTALKVLIDAVTTKLKEAANIKSNLTEIEKTVGKIRNQLDGMVDEIRSHMAQISGEVAKSQAHEM